VENVEILEKDLEKIQIGNAKIHVNKPRYRRTKGTQSGGWKTTDKSYAQVIMNGNKIIN